MRTIHETAERATWRLGMRLAKLARRWFTHLAQRSWWAEHLLGEAGFDVDRLGRRLLDGTEEVVAHGQPR